MAELIAVKGLGVWTAHMFLMFQLERPDVLPVGDLGIRRAIERAYGLDGLPDAPRSRRSRSPGARTGRSRAGTCGARCRTSPIAQVNLTVTPAEDLLPHVGAKPEVHDAVFTRFCARAPPAFGPA